MTVILAFCASEPGDRVAGAGVGDVVLCHHPTDRNTDPHL